MHVPQIIFKLIPEKPVLAFEVFQSARKSEEEIKAIKSKKVQDYYREMNDILDSFVEVEDVLRELRDEGLESTATINGSSDLNPQQYGSTSGTSSSQNKTQAVEAAHGTSSNASNGDLEEASPLLHTNRKERTSPTQISLAINGSFFANIFLVLIKVWAVFISDSMAVMASMLDSLMDLLSGAIIWYSAHLRSKTSDGHHYPVGKARMEPLGIIVFAAVMVTSFMQVMLQSIERLLAASSEVVDLGLVILILLGFNIFVKFLLWTWCRTIKDSPSVQALAQDHLNDVVFNILSIAFPMVGQYFGLWWLDALGDNIRRLTGQIATAADTQQLTYMTYRFSSLIQVIDTVRAYYVGDGLFVEVDIVLPPDTPLSQAHDLGESLQIALETLDSVERAFVHIDYNAEHKIEHTKRPNPV
ncbi:hypothetical protein BGZ76_003430 [Entomortierella beljakovae]|nr:hypothetical protein BGZ76_003430 [Entomortierella beljakovae]